MWDALLATQWVRGAAVHLRRTEEDDDDGKCPGFLLVQKEGHSLAALFGQHSVFFLLSHALQEHGAAFFGSKSPTDSLRRQQSSHYYTVALDLVRLGLVTALL